MKDFEILKWDSDFFGVKVAKVNPNIKQEDYYEVLQNMEEHQIDLAYLSSDFDLPSSKSFEIVDLGSNVAFTKKLDNNRDYYPGIRVYDASTPTNEMIGLSKRIARKSKFFLDPYIPNEKVYELYKLWIDKSVKGILADVVIVYEENGVVLGFVSIKINEKNEGVIPLLGVDARHEGKGISFFLMYALETYLLRNNCDILVSSTQAKNLKALKVYERFGVKCEKGRSINHLWRKPI